MSDQSNKTSYFVTLVLKERCCDCGIPCCSFAHNGAVSFAGRARIFGLAPKNHPLSHDSHIFLGALSGACSSFYPQVYSLEPPF